MMNFVNYFFRKIGLEVKKKKVYENIDNNPNKQIFGFFSTWISMFKLNDEVFGGNVDYTALRTSILNMDELYKYVDFAGKTILELGPLEGGNTIKLENLKVNKIISIEGRVESYIKCCVIKNLYNLDKTKFFLDDVRYINKEKYGKFDIAVI